jgi:hypothetical protein
MKTNAGNVCEFCKAKLESPFDKFCPGHEAMLRYQFLLLRGAPELSGPDDREKLVHFIAEAITRSYMVSPPRLPANATGGDRLRWAMAYDAALEWIVAEGGNAVWEKVTRARLGLDSLIE